MSAWYTITAIEPGEPRVWSGQGGTFHSFRVTLRNSEGRELEHVEINKKPGNTPRLGSENYGDVETGVEHGPKFKYGKPADGSPAVRGGSGGGGGSAPSGGGGDDYYRPGWAPEDLAAIRRQAALDFAARVSGLQLDPGTIDSKVEEAIARWVRFFEESVDQAVEEATATGPQAVVDRDEEPPTGDVDEEPPIDESQAPAEHEEGDLSF